MSTATALNEDGLFHADRAYLDTLAGGGTHAQSCHSAIEAYVNYERAVRSAQPFAVVQHVAAIPSDHADLAGGQVLVRSFDSGKSWEVCTRPDTYSTWSIGIRAVSA